MQPLPLTLKFIIAFHRPAAADRSCTKPSRGFRGTGEAGPTTLNRLCARLSASHGVVLHPHVCEPWYSSVLPFANGDLGPARRARLVGTFGIWCRIRNRCSRRRNTVIHARVGGEMEGRRYQYRPMTRLRRKVSGCISRAASAPRGTTSTIFAPPFYPFRQAADVQRGANRHGIPAGSACRFPRVQELGRNGTRFTAIDTGANGRLPRA